MFDRTLFTSSKRGIEEGALPSPPVFPLPVLNGQAPVVLVFDPQDPGIEIAYERNPQDGALVRSASRESTLYVVPPLVPVFAVGDGKIIYAREHSDGGAMLVAHRRGWATYYTRLEHMFATPTERSRRESPVKAGDILGYVGSWRTSPLQPLRFELWRYCDDHDYERIDPIRFLHRWRLMRWSSTRIKPVASAHAT